MTRLWGSATPARMLAVAGVALLPWTALLFRDLPAVYPAQNWNVAWTGLDCAIAAGALGTAYLHRRRDRRAALLASATATAALADAWFDVLTSATSADLAQAAGCAVIELGFAALCARVAYQALWDTPQPSGAVVTVPAPLPRQRVSA